MMQRKIYFFLSLCLIQSLGAMNVVQHINQNQDLYSRLGRHCIGVLGVGISSINLLTSPDLSFFGSTMNAGCFLLCLHNFLYDIKNVPLIMKKMSVPLLAASVFAARTRDSNRSLLDYLRTLSAGALISVGALRVVNDLLLKNTKYDTDAYGLILYGALLLSQKDIKSFFGLQKGYSLNPPSEVKNAVKDHHEKNIDIDRLLLERIEEGRMQSLPFIARLFAQRRPEIKQQTPSKCTISESDFASNILPYLRTTTQPSLILDDIWQQVFSTNAEQTGSLFSTVIKRYMSLEAYNRTPNN